MGSPEQATRQRSWARPLIFFLAAITLILYASISQIAGSLYFHLAGHEGGHSLAVQSFPPDVVSPDQSTATESREDLAKVLKTTSDFLDAISKEYHLDSLKSFSKDLRKHAADAHKSTLIAAASKELEARGFLEDLGNLVTGGGKGGGASGASAGATGAAAMSGITGIFGKLLGGLGNITLGALADPAQYLGDGVGRGVTAGLKVTNNAVTSAQKPTGLNAIADNLGFGVANGLTGSLNLSTLTSGGTLGDASNALGAGLGGGAATGLNLNTSAVPAGNQTGVALIAGNLGNGLTSSFFKSASLSSLMTGINGTQLTSAITNAGKGLGEGAAQGLKLPAATIAKRAATTTAGVSPTGTANSSIDIASVAYDFTKSLSSSFLGSVDVSKLVSSASGSMSNITGMITPALVGAGSGFGSGAAVGFGLQSEAVSVTSADADASTVGKNFAYQLTTSFLANGTVDGLSKALKSAGMTNVTAMIGPAAQGAGSGIGQGVAVGLGLQQAVSNTTSGGDIAMVARDFTYGLTSSFLANDTVAQIQKAASNISTGSSFSLSSLSISKVAEGAARGFIDGAGTSINNAGGVQAILGTSKVENPMSTSSSIFGDSSGFNDSVSGAATGFGYGLGAEGVNVVLIAIGKKTAPAPSTTPDAGPAPPETTGNLSTVAVRNLTPGNKAHFAKRGLETGKKSIVRKRAIDLSGIFASINSSDVNSVLQKGVDSLTCEGVGGASQIFAGLKSSNSLPTTTALPSGILPNATFTVFSGGNKFVIDPQNFGIFVNGLTINKLTLLIVFHAFLVILAYFVFIPLALSLEYGHAIAVLIVRPQKLLNAPRWKTFIWALGVLPLAIVGFILGIVLLGSASHFITPHGIIGLVTTIFMFIAAALETPVGKNFKPLRFIVLSLLILLSIVAFVTGFADIQRISLCTVQLPDAAFLVVSILVSISLVSGVTIFLVYWIMKKWMGSEGAVDDDMRGRLIEKSRDVKIVEIQHLGPNPKPRMPSLSDSKSYQR